MEPYVMKTIVMHSLFHVDIQRKNKKKEEEKENKHLTTSQCPHIDAAKNGDCPRLSCKLISALEPSKHLITSQCPNIDAANNGDWFIASKHGHMDVIKCLLSSRANINLRDKPGQSPLFVASQKGHCNIVKCLVSSGAEINLRDIWDQSPLFIASPSNSKRVFSMTSKPNTRLMLWLLHLTWFTIS
jgi:ankyrin repeat protein